MTGATDRGGLFWSLVSWGGGIVAFVLTYGIVRALFGGSAPDGLVFGSVAFMLVVAILTFRLGPNDAPEAGEHDGHGHAASSDAAAVASPVPLSEPVVAERNTLVTPAHEVQADPVPEPVAETSAEPAPVVEAVDGALAAPEPAEPVVEPIAETSAEPAPVAEPVDDAATPAPDLTDARSERVSEAAREAARLAADLEAPVVTPKQPARLDGPRGGAPDDLKKIKGVGPKLEGLLNKLGYYHFDQIAAWTPEEIAWVDANIEDFPGRATRDNWVGQAKALMGGGTTEFSQRVDRGEVY